MDAADPEVVEALRATDLFSSLSRRTLNKVARQAQVVHHPAGKQITAQGEGGVGFHLITAGSATVMVGGRPRMDLGPGDYFGEISLIDGKPRSATVTVTTDLTVIFIVSWVFTPLLDEETELTKALLLVMCARLRGAENE
jgi:CRP/FNR family cyclic AMP-dependent transcriptional regulator